MKSGIYKPGQFIATPLGKMRVKIGEFLPCEKCALYTGDFPNENCHKLAKMHESNYATLIGDYCYFEKIQ
jgi:hypothetical protein